MPHECNGRFWCVVRCRDLRSINCCNTYPFPIGVGFSQEVILHACLFTPRAGRRSTVPTCGTTGHVGDEFNKHHKPTLSRTCASMKSKFAPSVPSFLQAKKHMFQRLFGPSRAKTAGPAIALQGRRARCLSSLTIALLAEVTQTLARQLPLCAHRALHLAHPDPGPLHE